MKQSGTPDQSSFSGTRAPLCIDCDALVIDETSLVDVLLMHAVLKPIRDVDHLPSVGPGQVSPEEPRPDGTSI